MFDILWACTGWSAESDYPPPLYSAHFRTEAANYNWVDKQYNVFSLRVFTIGHADLYLFVCRPQTLGSMCDMFIYIYASKQIDSYQCFLIIC